ncbi:nitroreductase family protein [Limnohabitans sp.]|uniref:nitroreductase family protein n=1 Tax=Limnohabitans sp. TaxID=1907725 RepID=UPI002FDD2306
MSNDAAKALLAQMCARSHVAPKRLVAPGPTAEELDLIFTAAAQAPDHGNIQPWRFILVPQEKRAALGQAFLQALQERDANASKAERNFAFEKAFRAPCLILAVVDHGPTEPQVPVHERQIALGCAIQNMLLMAQTLSIGSGITSGQAMNSHFVREVFRLTPNEEAMCFLTFGQVTTYKSKRKRSDVSEIVSSME